MGRGVALRLHGYCRVPGALCSGEGVGAAGFRRPGRRGQQVHPSASGPTHSHGTNTVSRRNQNKHASLLPWLACRPSDVREGKLGDGKGEQERKNHNNAISAGIFLYVLSVYMKGIYKDHNVIIYIAVFYMDLRPQVGAAVCSTSARCPRHITGPRLLSEP